LEFDAAEDEFLTLVTLSAAQEYNEGENKFATWFSNPKNAGASIFKAICWYRRAAIHGHVYAPLLLSSLVMKAKKEVIDGVADLKQQRDAGNAI
jgi:TPR repeat protein